MPEFALLLLAACAALLGVLVLRLLQAQRSLRIVQHACARAKAEAVEARERASAANAARSAFLANISHEIRTPMNGVIGVIDLLQSSALNPAQRHYVDIAERSARILLRLINDILDYAKIESGKLTLNAAPYDLYAALEDITELHRPLANKKGVALHLAVMPHFDRWVLGDELRLHQVITNLLSNAISFTATGYIVLHARRRIHPSSDCIEITVRDTGTGMSEEYQRRLFLPFHQEDGSITRRHGGTGLGLSIVKHIIDRMEGSISISSRRGHGTTAIVRVPAIWASQSTPWPRYDGKSAVIRIGCPCLLRTVTSWLRKAGVRPCRNTHNGCALEISQQADGRILLSTHERSVAGVCAPRSFLAALHTLWHEPGGSHSPTPACLDSGPTRCLLESARGATAAAKQIPNDAPQILLVEDNEINRDITLHQLALLGVRALCAEDGQIGYSLWLEHRPSIVLVDCHMPKLDGYELAQRVRIHEMVQGWPRTVLIGFSANATRYDIETCLAAGMDDYVAKPATRATLLAAMQRAQQDLSRLAHFNPTPQICTMHPLLDLAALDQLYPDVAERNALLGRALALLRADRMATQEAVNQDNFWAARASLHRAKGTLSFLTHNGAILPMFSEFDAALAAGSADSIEEGLQKLIACLEQYEAALSQYACDAGDQATGAQSRTRLH